MKQRGIFSIIVLACAMWFFCHGNPASASSSFFGTYCASCHGTSATVSCAGCHAHGTHAGSSKNSINITAATNKTSYQPGETMSVTVNGGYRSGWVRVIVYDQNMKELARSTGTVISGAKAPSGGASLPVTLQVPAPTTPGTYTYNGAWYGNKFDLTDAGAGTTVFGPRWTPDPNNPNHGQEIVATNSFTVASVTPPPAPSVTVTDSVAPNTDLQVPFGSVNVGASASQTVTVTNSGNANLVVGSIGSGNSLAAPFSLINDTCSNQTIAPAASCTMTVRFAPTATGTATDSFSIPSNDTAKSPVTVNVSGTGTAVPAPAISVTDSVTPSNDLLMPFGTVSNGGSGVQTVTVTNNGNADLQIGQVGSANPLAAPFSLTNDTCSNRTIAPAASCAMTISFAPTAAGTFTDSFDIPSNDPAKASVILSVSGTGSSSTALGDIRVTDSVPPTDDLQIPFGTINQAVSMEQTVTITNVGTGDLAIGAIASSNPLPAPFSIASDGCSGQTISSGGSCTLTVRFAPTEAGTFTDSFDVPSNDPDQPAVTVQVSGTAVSSSQNNPPDRPKLRRPADHERGLGTELDMQWERASDPDGDRVSYELRIATDPDFRDTLQLGPNLKAGKTSGTLFASTGIGFIFFGFVFAGTSRGRKGLLVIAAATVLAGSALVGCSSGTNGTPLSTSAAVITQHVSGLQTSTTYYWKVVASDGNGGVSESDVSTFSTK